MSLAPTSNFSEGFDVKRSSKSQLQHSFFCVKFLAQNLFCSFRDPVDSKHSNEISNIKILKLAKYKSFSIF